MAIIAPANGPAYLAAVVRYKACYFSRAWSPSSAVPLPSLLPDPQAAGKADGGSFVGANRGGSAGGGAGAGAASGAAAGTGAAGAAPRQDGGRSGGGAGSAPSVEGDLALHFLCMLQREDPKCLPVQFVPLEVFPLNTLQSTAPQFLLRRVRTCDDACLSENVEWRRAGGR